MHSPCRVQLGDKVPSVEQRPGGLSAPSCSLSTLAGDGAGTQAGPQEGPREGGGGGFCRPPL